MKTKNKQFLFMYPIEEYFESEIENSAYSYGFKRTCPKEDKKFKQMIDNAKTEQEKDKIRKEALALMTARFKPIYSKILNACIEQRYRQNGFEINYAVFDGSPVSDVIKLQQSDRIIEVGLDFKTHTTKQPNGKFPYPNPSHILNQLMPIEIIRIAGFHMWDCVERIAKRAYEKGINVLVDEDLTEFFSWRLRHKDFVLDKYPTYNAREHQGSLFRTFMNARKGKPWLWQKY